VAKDRTILAAAIGGVFAVVGSAVGALISTHQGASAPSARSTVSAGVSAPAPGIPTLTTPAAMSSAPPAATTSAPTAGVAAGLNTPPGPLSAYTLLWQQLVTIGSGGLLFERAGPEPAQIPLIRNCLTSLRRRARFATSGRGAHSAILRRTSITLGAARRRRPAALRP
jgi:hypothetical protein